MNMPTRMINGFNSVKVQIEQNREDVAVPDGIAISNGMYDKDLSYDLPDSATVPMAMNKNGNQQLPYNQGTDITNFVARSGFSGTVISGNGLVVGQDQRAKRYLGELLISSKNLGQWRGGQNIIKLKDNFER